jgi:cytoskeletal protein CcmA (bactofilin family)
MTATTTINQTIEVTSKIGKGIHIRGDLFGSESILVEGAVDGAITAPGCHLVIGPTAGVDGGISAGSIQISGRVKGNVTASDRVEVRGSGSVMGDVNTHRISIEDGAFVRGRVEIRRVRIDANEFKNEPISLTLQFDLSLPQQSIRATLEALANYYRACGGVGFSVDDLQIEERPAAEALFA